MNDWKKNLLKKDLKISYFQVPLLLFLWGEIYFSDGISLSLVVYLKVMFDAEQCP